jgi:protein-tyrosine phosphatase
MNILFVCLGNICRSPIAHGIMQQLVVQHNLPWIIDSAGTNGIHTGEAPHIHSTSVCAEHGIDISKQVSRLFVPTDFEYYDKIYVMAKDVWIDVSHVAVQPDDMINVDYFLNSIYPNENRNVTDPWYGNREGYYAVYNEIEKGCKSILQQLIADKKEAQY